MSKPRLDQKSAEFSSQCGGVTACYGVKGFESRGCPLARTFIEQLLHEGLYNCSAARRFLSVTIVYGKAGTMGWRQCLSMVSGKNGDTPVEGFNSFMMTMTTFGSTGFSTLGWFCPIRRLSVSPKVRRKNVDDQQQGGLKLERNLENIEENSLGKQTEVKGQAGGDTASLGQSRTRIQAS